MKRFQGTIIAAVVLVLVLIVVASQQKPTRSRDDIRQTPALFSFEKKSLQKVTIERPDLSLELVNQDGSWVAVGHPWEPSASMLRRVAHQHHDLTARAVVAEHANAEELDRYGLGDGAITVHLWLEGGEEVQFVAGDPNPSNVSYYIRPLPGDAVYVVKKSALDYFALPLESFREHRVNGFDADDADAIAATVDGRELAVHRTGEKQWSMTAPVAQEADREEVRALLGRISAMKVQRFVADAPTEDERAKLGLVPAQHRISVSLSTGRTLTVEVGDAVPGEPDHVYVYKVEDNAIYEVRNGFLDSYRHEPERYRRKRLFTFDDGAVVRAEVTQAGKTLEIRRTSDGWRWPDDQPISGSTPRRVVGQATDLSARAFLETRPSDAALDPADRRVVLHGADGVLGEIGLGACFEIPPPEDMPEEFARPEKRCYAAVPGRTETFEISAGLESVIEDLFREHARKADKDEKRDVRRMLQERAEEQEVDGDEAGE